MRKVLILALGILGPAYGYAQVNQEIVGNGNSQIIQGGSGNVQIIQGKNEGTSQFTIWSDGEKQIEGRTYRCHGYIVGTPDRKVWCCPGQAGTRVENSSVRCNDGRAPRLLSPERTPPPKIERDAGEDGTPGR